MLLKVGEHERVRGVAQVEEQHGEREQAEKGRAVVEHPGGLHISQPGHGAGKKRRHLVGDARHAENEERVQRAVVRDVSEDEPNEHDKQASGRRKNRGSHAGKDCVKNTVCLAAQSDEWSPALAAIQRWPNVTRWPSRSHPSGRAFWVRGCKSPFGRPS